MEPQKQRILRVWPEERRARRRFFRAWGFVLVFGGRIDHNSRQYSRPRGVSGNRIRRSRFLKE